MSLLVSFFFYYEPQGMAGQFVDIDAGVILSSRVIVTKSLPL